MIKLTPTTEDMTLTDLSNFKIDGEPLKSITILRGSTIILNQ